ncbi:hypothetical protein ACFFRR_002859 [Megaselia abdita]
MYTSQSPYYRYSRILFGIIYIQSKLAGAFTISINYKTRLMYKSRSGLIYSSIVHSFIGCCVFYLIYETHRTSQWGSICGSNKVLCFVKMFDGIVLILVCTITYMIDFVSQDKLIKVANSLGSLNMNYFRDAPHPAQRKLFFYVFGKCVNVLLIMLTHALMTLDAKRDSLSMVFFIAYSMIFNFLEMSVTIIFYVVAVVTKFYGVTNIKLEKLLHEIKNKSMFSSLNNLEKRTDNIADIYREIHRIQQDLIGYYKIHIMGMLLTTFVNSIMKSFHLYVYCLKDEINLRQLNLMVLASVLQCLDVLFLIHVCAENSDAALKARRLISRETSTYREVDKSLERSLEMLTMQLMKDKVEYRVGGFYSLNRKFSLVILSSSLMYLIILIQFNYDFEI